MLQGTGFAGAFRRPVPALPVFRQPGGTAMSIGFYSVIQYCPDLARMEGVNIGLALFCPGQDGRQPVSQVKTTGEPNRLYKLFTKSIIDPSGYEFACRSVE